MTNRLTEISGFDDLLKLYNQNKDQNWKNWLNFKSLFPKPGKQGLVGIMEIKENDKNDNQKNNNQIVFKISQYINYLVYHEYCVMKSLNDIADYCPHFCKAIGIISTQVDPKFRKTENPFEINSKHPITKEVLLAEHISNACKFYNYIRSDKIPEQTLYSTIKQVLMAITIAQKEKQFTHYDLHSYNVMMKKCNKDLLFLYVLDEENQFLVPTYGHYPVIIDFGFSYIQDMEDGPCWPSLSHTDVGFMSDRFDWVSDPKLFLVTVSEEIKDKRKSKKSKKFSNIIRNIFGRLKIDWDSGWDTEKKGATDYVTEMLEGYAQGSHIFDKLDFYCIDLIQTMIILPLEEQDYNDIDKSYVGFVKEFTKIENEIGNPFYNLYVLKGIVDIARKIRPDYLNKETRTKAVAYFRQELHNRIDSIAKYCRPKEIHYERMLCSLLCFARSMEGLLYDVMYTRMKKKEKQYEKIPLQSIEQIYGTIDINLPDEYVMNRDSVIYVFDRLKKKCEVIKLDDESCEEVNSLKGYERGVYVYGKYAGQ